MGRYYNGVRQTPQVPASDGGAGGAGVAVVPQYGVTLPSNPSEGQIFELLKKVQISEAYVEEIDRTGVLLAGDWGNRSVGILTLEDSTGLHIPFDSVIDAVHFRRLLPGDKILGVAEGVADFLVTLEQAMTWESDSRTLFSPSAGGYSHTGSIVGDTRYTLFALRINRYLKRKRC